MIFYALIAATLFIIALAVLYRSSPSLRIEMEQPKYTFLRQERRFR